MKSFGFTRSQQGIIILLIASALLAGSILFIDGRNEGRDRAKIEIKHLAFELPAKAEVLTRPLRVNINTASVEELIMLPCIGTVTAQKIIDYRKRHGGFRSVQEIIEVPCIGPKTFEKIKAMIYVPNSIDRVGLKEATIKLPPEKKPNPDNPFPQVKSGTKAETSAPEITDQGRININTASVQKLILLPGIGKVTAQRIIDYRQRHGGFKSIEEIMEVPRIGPKTFEKIKDMIRIEKGG